MERYMRESDAFTWYLEGDPVLRSTVISALWLDTGPDWPGLRARMEVATRLVPAFRQRLIELPARLSAPRWEVDPEFDLSWHLGRMAAPTEEGEGFVMGVARREAITGFDQVRPLWRFTLIEGLPGGRAALVMKMHHSLMDGVGAMQLAFSLLDKDRNPGPPTGIPDAPPGARIGGFEVFRDHLAWRAGQAARLGGRLARRAVPAAASLVCRPVSSSLSAVGMVGSVGRTVAPLFDTLSPIMTGRGTGRYLDCIEVALPRMRAAARFAGGTVNDVLVAAAAGGLRIYHEGHGVPADRLRLMMPINLRRSGDPVGGNRITLMRYEVPVGERDPVRRIAEIDRRSRAVRHEPSLPYTNVIAGGLNLLPPAAVGSIFKHVDFLVSDVPGFPEPVYLAGAKVERHAAFGPTTGTALNLTLLSYCDSCHIGINMDTAAIPDPERMVDCLRAGFDEVLRLADEAPGRRGQRATR
jgi:diacylglycerol O-acyltransferase / wax synthase